MDFSPEDIKRAEKIKKRRAEVLYGSNDKDGLTCTTLEFKIGNPAFHLIRDDLPWLLDFLLPKTPEEQEFLDSLTRARDHHGKT